MGNIFKLFTLTGLILSGPGFFQLGAQTNYELFVEPGPRQTFQGIGASQVYIWQSLTNIPEKPRHKMTDLVYRDLGFNILRMWHGTGPEETVKKMKDGFYSEYADAIKEIQSRAPGVTTLLLAPARGDSHPEVPMSEYSERIAQFMLEVKNERDIAITATGIANEPGHWTVEQIVDATKYLRRELDERGLHEVKIISPECASNDRDLNEKLDGLYRDKEAWDAIDGIASHSYNMAATDAQAERTRGKEFWMTEASTNGNEHREDEDMACTAAARFLNDMNHRVTHWVWFIGFSNSKDVTVDRDNATKLMVYDEATREIFIHLKYYYFKQLLSTFDKGAVFRRMVSDTEKDMPYTYGQKPAINAAAGINPDGSWAIGIVNGTGIPGSPPLTDWYSARAYKVNTTIEELKGSDSKTFDVYRSSAHNHFVHSGTMEIENGKFSITIAPKELVTLREASMH